MPARRHRKNFFDVVAFLLSSLVSGPSFMSVSVLVLELSQILFIRVLTRNLENEKILPWVLSNNWRPGRIRGAKFGMNVSNDNLLNYLMLQNVMFTALTVSELLRENQQGGVKKFPLAPS